MISIKIILQILFIAVLAYLFFRWVKGAAFVYWSALILKMICGFVVGYLYLYHYDGGDTRSYYQDALKLAGLFEQDPPAYLDVFLRLHHNTEGYLILDPRAFVFVKFLSLMVLLSFNNYWILSMLLSFISFAASWWLVTRLKILNNKLFYSACVSFLFFPSIVFWSSGVLRDTIVFSIVLILCAMIVDLWMARRPAVWQLLIAIPLLYLLFLLRYYVGAVLIPVWLSLVIYRVFQQYNFRWVVQWPVVSWSVLIIVPALCITFTYYNLHIDKVFLVLVENHDAYVQSGKADIHYEDLSPNLTRIAANIPRAFFFGLFKPFPWEVRNELQAVASFENILIVILIAILVFSGRFQINKQVSVLVLASMLYFFTLAILVPMSTPNLGTLSRYKIMYLPFIIFLMLCHPAILHPLERYINRLGKIVQ